MGGAKTKIKGTKEKKSPGRLSFVSRLSARKEREYLLEQFALLLASGMDMFATIEALQGDLKNKQLRNVLHDVSEQINAGSNLSKALAPTNLFSAHVIALIRVGEESGRLAENLKVVADQEKKERVFRSRIRSAMFYPVLVLTLAFVIGIGITWFILPKLGTVFNQLNVELPTITRVLINAGSFIGEHGLLLFGALFALFLGVGILVTTVRRLRSSLAQLAFRLPVIRGLIKEVEISRFGYVLGSLLDAGIPVLEALQSLRDATANRSYAALYEHLQRRLSDGDSFRKGFGSAPGSSKLIPGTVQRMVISGEQSGKLPETLRNIGQRYEEKTEMTTKNLATLLEPILLVFVWVIVLLVAIAVILPIYSLIGGLN